MKDILPLFNNFCQEVKISTSPENTFSKIKYTSILIEKVCKSQLDRRGHLHENMSCSVHRSWIIYHLAGPYFKRPRIMRMPHPQEGNLLSMWHITVFNKGDLPENVDYCGKSQNYSNSSDN